MYKQVMTELKTMPHFKNFSAMLHVQHTKKLFDKIEVKQIAISMLLMSNSTSTVLKGKKTQTNADEN